MRERPIIFSGPMVRALRSGCKTQTRRIASMEKDVREPRPYAMPGEVLWVKESWRTLASLDALKPSQLPVSAPIQYQADTDIQEMNMGMSARWRTPLFMPKHLSRIRLAIVDTRLERLHDCSEADAKAEGLADVAWTLASTLPCALSWYRMNWERIHGAGSWSDNPLVWVVQFTVS